jgi:YfiH family protein
MSSFDVRQSGEVQAIVCRPLEAAGFLNAFSTRPGGVSPMPAHDLNLAYNEDAAANVEENRRLFLRAAGLPSWPIVTARQTHSADVIEVPAAAQAEQEADALFTQSPAALLAIKTADCVPILLGDPATGFSCGVHSGWRGASANVIGAAIAALTKAGARADSLLAAIGPSACANCFEIGADVAARFSAMGFEGAVVSMNSASHLNLEDVCARQLQAAGVRAANVYRSERCTIHEKPLFFSHRREGKLGRPVGRMISVIGRRP